MKQHLPLALVMLLLAELPVVGQAGPVGQPTPVQKDGEGHLPAELGWITQFAARVQKNPQGYWEVELMVGIEMVHVPLGDLAMGSPRDEVGREWDEGPVHRVRIEGFWIGKHEITRATWQAVMGGRAPRSEELDLPKGDVSFHEVQTFLLALHRRSGLRFRLPTEAEWERSCRGGTPSPHEAALDAIAWHVDNAGDRPHSIGKKSANGLGLFDMLGNVWEWCSDWYSPTYYQRSPGLNPTGPETGTRRVCRGGGYRHGGNYLRCSHRNDQEPSKGKPYLGFRVVLDDAR